MIALVEPEGCALAGTDCRPLHLRRRAGRPQLKLDPLGSTLMDSSVQQQWQSSQQRHRLTTFAVTGAALVPVAVLVFQPSIYWPGPRGLLWVFLGTFGAFLGALLWFAGLVRRAQRESTPSAADVIRHWEAEEQRFSALRERAAQNPQVAEQYLRELEHLIEELEFIISEHDEAYSSLNLETELARLRDDVTWAKKQVGRGAA